MTLRPHPAPPIPRARLAEAYAALVRASEILADTSARYTPTGTELFAQIEAWRLPIEDFAELVADLRTECADWLDGLACDHPTSSGMPRTRDDAYIQGVRCHDCDREAHELEQIRRSADS